MNQSGSLLRLLHLVGLLWLVPLVSLADSDLPPAAQRTVDFANDIQPIFTQRCIACHGAEKRRGGLRLDRASDAQVGGDTGPAFIPGRSDESLLIEKVAGLDPVGIMPPKGDPLDDAQIGLLRAWIDQGADWPVDPVEAGTKSGETHWAFRPVKRPALPEVQNRSWPRNPIDRFVLAKFEREGLNPSPEADRFTLVRRLYLDLIGLPPSIDEVESFLADDRPDAYERLVERLLASPHYGELWGRRWLDAARYADTNGYEKDRPRSIWPYRDWVIRALNDDMPFDQFTIEQIAGDMLPDASLSQKIATGFHRNTMINEEGGIDVEEFRFASLIDRVATTGTVWLGLTIQCAQCHSHKFDPITQREYYQFLAFLNNADEPEIEVPTPPITQRRSEIQREVNARMADLRNQFPLPEERDTSVSIEEQRNQHLKSRLAEWEAQVHPVRWTTLTPTTLVSAKHATMEILDDQSVLVSGDKPNNDTYVVELPTHLEGITALRLEVLPHESLPDGGPGRAPLFSVGDFLLTELQVGATTPDDPETVRPLQLQDATEDYCEKGHPAGKAIDGISDTGWNIKGATGQAHAAVFSFTEPVGDARGFRMVLTMHQEYIHQMTIGRFRVSVTTDPQPVKASGLPTEVETALLVPADQRTEAQSERIQRHFLSVTPELAEQNKAITALRKAMPEHPTTMIMRDAGASTNGRRTSIDGENSSVQPSRSSRGCLPCSTPCLMTCHATD